MAITNAIDISEYQDPNRFDYQAAKDAGVKAIIIRLGHGHTQDKYVTQHLVKAKQYGFKIAGYFYYEGTSGEVEYSLNLAKQLLDSGSYYFLDMEGNLGGNWQSQFCDFRSEWLKAGFKVGLYVSDSPYQNRFDNAKLVSDGVYRWIASYSYEPANYDMWQSGSKGGFGSYTGNVDHDYDKTGSIINFTADQPSEPDRPDSKPTPPSKDDGYIQDIVNQPGYDTETGIYGRGYSHDNGAHFYVQETIYGRKYRQEDADRLYPFLKKYFSTSGPVETSLHWADILDKPDLITKQQLDDRLTAFTPAVSWDQVTGKPDLATQDDLKKIELTPGPPGKDGSPGSDGKSAYQIAVDHGFVGSEAEWLQSLHGKDVASGNGDASLSIEAITDLIKQHIHATVDTQSGQLTVSTDDTDNGSIADAVAAKVVSSMSWKLSTDGELIAEVGGE